MEQARQDFEQLNLLRDEAERNGDRREAERIRNMQRAVQMRIGEIREQMLQDWESQSQVGRNDIKGDLDEDITKSGGSDQSSSKLNQWDVWDNYRGDYKAKSLNSHTPSYKYSPKFSDETTLPILKQRSSRPLTQGLTPIYSNSKVNKHQQSSGKGIRKQRTIPRSKLGGEVFKNIQAGRRRAGMPFVSKRGGIAIYEFTPTTKRFLDENGNKMVQTITLCKSPVQGFVGTALDLITAGRMSELMKQFGYDEMFHVYALLHMQNGETFFLEKNQTILAGVATGEYLTPKESIESPAFEPMELNDMIEKTRALMGPENFFDYKGYSTNCQDFLLNFLKANGLDSQVTHDFLFQDAKAIFDNLPDFYKTIVKAATDIAGIWDFAKGGRHDPSNPASMWDDFAEGLI